ASGSYGFCLRAAVAARVSPARTIGCVRIEEQIEIRQSPGEVWDYVADPLNDPQWCSKVKAAEASGPNQWSVWHKPVPFRPRVLLTVKHVVVERPNRLTMREEDHAG